MTDDLGDHSQHKRDANSIRKQFTVLFERLQRVPDSARARIQGELIDILLSQASKIDTPRGALSFVPFGRGGAKRALTLLTKQPGTIEWIDGFRPNSVFWDIGANVGIYTLYAALRADTTIVAFEPAAVNYFLLAANCEINGFDQRVQCVLVGLGRDKAVASLEVSQFSVGQSFSFLGKAARPHAGRQAAIVIAIDQFVEEYGLACPNYIKIDVPHMTADILAGAARTLARPEVREVHVEIDEQSSEGRLLIDALERCGLALKQTDTRAYSDLTFVRREA